MKKFWAIFFICTLFSPSHHYAIEHKLETDVIRFPIQPYLAEETDLLDFVSPFKMASTSVGGSLPIKSHWFSPCIEWKLEYPFYDQTVARGVDVSLLFSQNVFSQNEDVAFYDVLCTYKKKRPIDTAIGCFAATVTGKAGLAGFNAFGSAPIDSSASSDIGIAGIIGLAVGLDYYFSQWVGCYVELSMKGRGCFFLKSQSERPFSFYYSPTLTAGFKTTI